MKRKSPNQIITILFLLLTSFSFNGCDVNKTNKELFSIAFLTDTHLQPQLSADEGFSKAIDEVNKLNPDLIITGGDQIMDALGQSYGRADSLYNLYISLSKKANMPVYNTMGNHEIYGIYRSRSGADPANPEYGEKMFEKKIGPSYYSFDHKGWKFFILNSIEDSGKESYLGLIDSAQIEWIKSELATTDKNVPLVISTHIPFITAYTQKYEGSTFNNDSSLVVSNSKDILDLFSTHNLKLVLQGHLHTVEDIYIDNIHFITGGAVSGGWWRGPNRNFEEGFLYLTFTKNDFSWRYVDYGWEPVINQEVK